MEGDEMYFFGAISIASQDAFLDFIAAEDTSRVRTFVINSLGGDTHSGRVIGRWIHQQDLTVTVDAICFSSCANYIFPAGADRIIRADSFVGWHGSETQYDVIAESLPGQSGDDLERAALRAALIPALPEGATGEIIEQAIDQQIAIANASRTEEAEFFETIGIGPEFTLHAMRHGNLDAWRASGLAGWTYTLEDMNRLGLGPVTFLGEGPYETSRQVTRNVFVVPYDTELAGQ
ncbi:hypothetical protein GTF97_12415 [Roseobacter sp. HKCCD8767]|uniref:hypothetical protein n=2 Tax=unclassified Roseobacter TaxID=196798 RepID=UPI0014913E79|nr:MULTISPECIES: hypothetical protein [unclassified Roseobacter]NNV68539.1 hypothetical protein [Roseobacter sp. HKCCD8474]NNV93552.1 hypothetical protein [Roseobacter sp. HKCCD8914]NNW11120.1 hypothetical protein [Roseobacter sp. HKCCD8484]NNW19641.1 hypothetical protein [Roseobacter sp. HKCCD7543]NNW46997.1 hypothetical protein [Roseobacter sp. HKCCD8291]NNW61753.1 hypothetical protein [Roseobacter sp. HKCCD8268]NNX21354.1 hypothetical protein [Roseobacter sp. HKCCD8626]NNX34752.1 hypothe